MTFLRNRRSSYLRLNMTDMNNITRFNFVSAQYANQLFSIIDLMGTTPISDYGIWVFIIVYWLIVLSYFRE